MEIASNPIYRKEPALLLTHNPDLKVCGAKNRNKDTFCKNTLVMENGRCRMHGGATPNGIASPHFVNGKTSKYFYLPENLKSRASGLLNDTIKNLEESINIQKALETQYLEKLGTGESTEAWIKLQKAVKEYDEAEPADRAYAFGMIRFIVKDGLNASFLNRDIQNIQESQRKLTETLSKVRKEAQEIYTQEEFGMFAGIILRILKDAIDDRRLLGKIQTEFRRQITNGQTNGQNVK